MTVPPFQLTPRVIALCAEVERVLGRVEGLVGGAPEPRLRRANRIRTIRATVAIEGNGLTVSQVTAVLDATRVRGPVKDIREVQNAIAAYELAPRLRPYATSDLLRAHRVLMAGLIADAGRYRTGNVGILRGTRVTHVAPQAKHVPRLVSSLLAFARRDRAAPLLVRACVVHYELEFIHPFSDGNGRIGRLWQQVMLLSHSPVFAYVPTESVIHARQREYYAALRASDRAADCTRFVEFSLTAIRDALTDVAREVRPARQDVTARLATARERFGTTEFSRKDYQQLHRTLSTATASRDLKHGVDHSALRKHGHLNQARYTFKPTTPSRRRHSDPE